MKRENPRTNRFLEELRLANWALESPTAVIMPNMMQKRPPMIGSGIVTKKAPSFEKRPKTTMTAPPY